jgi:hypothetical protein
VSICATRSIRMSSAWSSSIARPLRTQPVLLPHRAGLVSLCSRIKRKAPIQPKWVHAVPKLRPSSLSQVR